MRFVGKFLPFSHVCEEAGEGGNGIARWNFGVMMSPRLGLDWDGVVGYGRCVLAGRRLNAELDNVKG